MRPALAGSTLVDYRVRACYDPVAMTLDQIRAAKGEALLEQQETAGALSRATQSSVEIQGQIRALLDAANDAMAVTQWLEVGQIIDRLAALRPRLDAAMSVEQDAFRLHDNAKAKVRALGVDHQ